MDCAADDLRRAGYAVWNIDYRGVDRPGGHASTYALDVRAGDLAVLEVGTGEACDPR